MRLIEKIILLLLGISLLPLMIVGSLLYFGARTTTEHQITQQLSSIVTIQQNRIDYIRAQNLTRLADFTSSGQRRALLDTYNRTRDKAAQAKIMTILNDTKGQSTGIQSIIIMDSTGHVVASTEPETMASSRVASDLFKLGINKNSTKLTTSADGHGTIFYLSGPLELGGNKIGVAGIVMSADELTRVVADRTGLGKTGEIILGQKLENGSLTYATALRFDSHAANRVITNDQPMHEALMGKEAVFSDIQDYRGHDSFAVTRYIKESGWGLEAKIDRSEALLPLTGLRSQFLLLAFINSVLVVFASIAIARYVTQPILDIDEVAEQTSRGTLKKRVANISNDEIGNLAGTFNNMLDNLEGLDKAKSDFVSLASHQLRTPLTAIKWISEELLSPAAPLSEDRKEHYLHQIHATNERMIRLVNELLETSRIGFGTLTSKPEEVRVEEVLRLVLRDIAPEIAKSGVKVKTNIGKDLSATYIDRTWIQVMLQNIVSNALKYSKSGQAVAITIDGTKDEIMIQVKDNGCGIPLSQQHKIFTKLFRADNARQLVGDGSGLGLYITKALVEQAGGKIWFKSVEDKGSTFYVKLPVTTKAPSKKEPL
ncbi:MAG TPA: HAMP domain-containing sensor histidine kinase [Candidatus Saccharimonadales bacterium]|nr:HAMP domain-containing sensor histidine kinase [Candidatus Saccharimonadales bacterium]